MSGPTPAAAAPAAPETVAPDQRTPLRTISFTLLAIFITYLVVGGGGGANGTYVASWRMLTLLLTSLALGAWVIVGGRDARWRPASAIWPALVALTLIFAIATLTSWNVRLSIEMTAHLWLVLGLYLLLRQVLHSPFFEPRILVLCAGFAAVVGIAFLASVLAGWIDWWSLVGRLAVPPLRPGYEGLTFGSPNAVAAVVVLLAAPAAAFIGTGSRGRRLATCFLVGLAALVTLLSGSRGAWLGMAVAVVLTGAVHFDRARARQLRRALRARPALSLLVAAVPVIVALPLAPVVLARLFGGSGTDLRATLTAVSVRMFEAAPLTGSGPGTWSPRRVSLTMPGETDYYIPHAHNVYAQVLAEFGIVGIVATAVVAACLFWLIRSGLRRSDAMTRRMAVAALFGLVFLGVQQIVDSHMNMLSVLFAVAVPIAWLDARSPHSIPIPLGPWAPVGWPGGQGRPRTALAVGAIAVALTVGAAGFLAWSNLRALDSQRVADLAQGNWPEAHRIASRLADEDPGVTGYHFVLGLAAARVGAIDQANVAFEISASKDDFPQAWLNLAAGRLQAGQLPAAREALDRALRLGRQDVAVAFPSGGILLQLGDQDAAIRAFVDALLLAPSLAGDGYWDEPQVAPIADAVFDRAIKQAGAGSGVEIALLAGRTDQAVALAASLDPAQREFANLVISAWIGAVGATEAMRARAAADPFDTQAVAWSARLAHRAGNDALAREYRDQLDLMNTFTAIGAGSDLGVADGGGTTFAGGQPQPGLNNGWSYGVFTYTRQIPLDIFVPAVPHLVLR